MVMLLVAAVLAPQSSGWTPTHKPRYQHISNQNNGAHSAQFWNYDGESNFGTPSRDWPISLIFYGPGADVDNVKVKINAFNFTFKGGQKWEPFRVDRFAYNRLDADKGRKKCYNGTVADHVRVYASGSDRLYDPAMPGGYYVVASTHLDKNDPPCNGPQGPQYSGYSERVENRIADYFDPGYYVRRDFYNLHNYEKRRDVGKGGNHRWQSDGKATAIRIP
jgi:hypothetical protein